MTYNLLVTKKVEIITEVKTASPFGYRTEKPWKELFLLAEKVGDIISVHTDARWDGSFELLKRARRLTTKPILAKGIHQNDILVQKAFRHGADFVLVVGRVPKVNPERCFIEPYTLDELKKVPKNLKVVWNSRNLLDGGLKRETFEDARRVFSRWLCQASNLRTVADIKDGADAVLVGTHLQEFVDSF